MVDSAPRQLEAAAYGNFFECILDCLDHLMNREDLVDRRVFQEEHKTWPKKMFGIVPPACGSDYRYRSFNITVTRGCWNGQQQEDHLLLSDD